MLGVLFLAPVVFAQDQQQPTVKQPVVITVEPIDQEVAPGQRSAIVITFKVPKYIWLGARSEEARTPPGTKIKFKKNENFLFEDPLYPEPNVEGVPVHVGVTKVYEGEINVVVPYRVSDDARTGDHEITTFLTYTPGFNAGKLSTKANQPHTVRVRVVEDARPAASLPEPGIAPVPESFTVQPASGWDLPAITKPMFYTYKDGTAVSRTLHTLFLDPPNHGKNLKHVMYPFTASTKQDGNSFGVGMAILNSTPEGVMTGALSGFLYSNEFVGLTGGFDLITCPAAYHNIQVSTRFSGDDYSEFDMQYENLTFGAEDRFGIQADMNFGSDPRFIYYGVGRGQDEEDVSAYDQVQRKIVVDFLYTPLEKFRIGIGGRFRNVEVGRGLSDIDGDEFDLDQPNVPLLQDQFPNDRRAVNSTVFGGRIRMIYDGRNQEFNPTSGFFGEATAEINSITDFGDGNGTGLDDNFAQFNIDMRKYISTPTQKLSFLLRNNWTFTTERDLPFYELASIGGLESIRAFGVNRFRDQHSFFASMEMRYVMAKMKIMGFPMVMMMSAYLDAGQSFNEDSPLNFGDDFNWSPGASLRFVNYPNVGYIVNIASGQDGLNITGGISLPF